MHSVFAVRKEKVAGICWHHGVMRLVVFGSAARGDDFDPATSAADFLVKFGPDDEVDPSDPYFNLVDALRGALERLVDPVEKGAVTNKYLLAAINRSRDLVHAA